MIMKLNCKLKKIAIVEFNFVQLQIPLLQIQFNPRPAGPLDFPPPAGGGGGGRLNAPP